MATDSVELRTRAFGSACYICVENTEGQGHDLLVSAKLELQRLEEKFSSRHPQSIVTRLNQLAGSGTYVSLDDESHSLLEFINALWHQSNHQFDPTLAVLSSCYTEDGPVTGGKKQIQSQMVFVGWADLDISGRGACLPTRRMRIDLNNCVRPYAVDSIRRLFLKRGVGSALVSLDEDIATIGKQLDGANWLVGVKHPKRGGEAIARLKLNDRGYAIRGDFKRCFNIEGERFGRALSPIDGAPIPGLLAVGVMADTCLEACGAAHVARVKTEATALTWLEKLGLPWFAIDRNFQCHGLLENRAG